MLLELVDGSLHALDSRPMCCERDGDAGPWLLGYGESSDAEYCEAGGRLEDADPDQVSSSAKERGRPQIGTIGSGNHFLEIQYVERVEDEGELHAVAASAAASSSARVSTRTGK